jgi:hypothetical protein
MSDTNKIDLKVKLATINLFLKENNLPVINPINRYIKICDDKVSNPITSEQLKEWIAALKSGKYEHGTDTLHYKDNSIERYCCLGVFCKINDKLRISDTGSYFASIDTVILPVLEKYENENKNKG